MRDQKELHVFWNGLMDQLSTEGRAELLYLGGDSGAAFDVLMSEPIKG